MSTDKFKELDYYGLAYFWNKIKNKFAAKTELGAKANDTDVVHKSGDETVSGVKNFTSLTTKSTKLERGSVPTTDIREDPMFISVDKNGKRTLAFYNYYFTSGYGRTVLYAYNPNTSDYDNIGLAFSFSDSNKYIHPYEGGVVNLGTPSNKWVSINGINPGALSFPSTSYVNIDTTEWVLDGNTFFNISNSSSYGYLAIMTDCNDDGFIALSLGNYPNGYANINTKSVKGYCGIFVPVFNVNAYCRLCLKANSIRYARFFPCQGNV